MSDVTIAAVIPLHNKGRFIGRAVSSVLVQTRAVDEIIIVDDASSDSGSVEVAAFLADPRFRLLKRDTPGPGGYAARNLAISSAASQWIAFLDADDTWKPDFLEEIAHMARLAGDDVGCVFTGHEKVWADQRTVRDRYSVRYESAGIRRLDFDSFLTDWIAMGMSPIWTSACAIRRDILLEIGMFPEGRCRLGGDKDTWLRTLARTDAMSSPRAGATYYTVTENQVTRTEAQNHRPCLNASIEAMLAQAAGRRHELLLRLLNLEAFERAILASARAPVHPGVYRGFDFRKNPMRYGLVLGLAHLPAPLRTMLRALIIKGRGLIRRFEGGSLVVSVGASSE
jgi:glycosyltransferase involved in cell wall biosynthesis